MIEHVPDFCKNLAMYYLHPTAFSRCGGATLSKRFSGDGGNRPG
jgi:hypothetical protein